MKAQDLKSFDPELLLQELRAWEIQEAEDKGNGTSTLNGPYFGQRYNLCRNEPFRNQPIIAFCSGLGARCLCFAATTGW